MKNSKGKLCGSTRKLAKERSERGRPPVTHYLQEFLPGERVHIDIVSSETGGMPHPRFQGKTGVVKKKQGKSYVVEITDGGASKCLIAAPVHLKRAKAA
jgi:large subunit ribosomal protein L21e